MKLADVIESLRGLAPEHLAEPWDRVGLHVGRLDASVRRALLCIDLTEAVLAEAIRGSAELIVAYHPPIFQPLVAVTDATVKSRIVLGAAQARIAVYSPHTALDAAEEGVNHWLAAGIGPGVVQPIRPAGVTGQVKLVVFVPMEQADRLRTVLSEAGAGQIGHYSQCSFGVAGEGTFAGDETTHPAVGQAGRLERVNELRMEMVMPRERIGAVAAALRQAHPYEEPAFDLYPLETDVSAARQGGPRQVGQGRVVTLERAVSLATLIARVKKQLGVKHLQVGKVKAARRIKRVGLCAGAGGSLLGEAGQVDAFLTGEMRHHEVLAATADGVTVLLAGHTQTERPYLKVYRRRIKAAGLGGIEWTISRTDAPPSVLR